MSPEEFILKNVDIKTAGTAHLLDSSFIRNLMNEYANHRVEEFVNMKNDSRPKLHYLNPIPGIED